MKRKKFIKLLGGYGISRNTANSMAEHVRQTGGTYLHGLEYFEALRDEITRRIEKAFMDALWHSNPMSDQVGMISDLRPYRGPLSKADELSTAPHFKPIYRIDTKPLDPEPATLWEKVNPHLDGYSAKVHIVDELHTAGGGRE